MGAWIETYFKCEWLANILVAPHVGAWIETLNIANVTVEKLVAPHVGAWIETRPARLRRYSD